MKIKKHLPLTVVAIAMTMTISAANAAAKPLKVYILAGQSNMQGKAKVRTIERLNMTEDGKAMYEDMVGKDGKPVAVKDTYGAYFTAYRSGPVAVKGPLSPTYGAEFNPEQNFGPEFTFGIYMQKHSNEPILIIKTAWGGKNLLQQFRPPSGGEYPLPENKVIKLKAEGKLDAGLAEHKKANGEYYRLMMEHVKTVLADPSKYHPAYDKAAGYEIAGFVWFQGFNDLVGPYPRVDADEGKKGPKDWSEYSRLLACFIRDVRTELKVPKMPFVIGVIGVGGELKPEDNQQFFRKAMAEPTAMEEFKGNVSAVLTGQFWDKKAAKLQQRIEDATEKAVLAKHPEYKGRAGAIREGKKKMRAAVAKEALTAEEQAFLKLAVSNQAYHYNGSAYTYGKIGKAFADSMAKLQGLKVKVK